MRHPRQVFVWFCIAAALWMGVGFQLHGLSHSLQSLHAASLEETLPGHAPECEQCLLFAALDGGIVSSHSLAWLPRAPVAMDRSVAFTPLRPVVFTAYASRAPPAAC